MDFQVAQKFLKNVLRILHQKKYLFSFAFKIVIAILIKVQGEQKTMVVSL